MKDDFVNESSSSSVQHQLLVLQAEEREKRHALAGDAVSYGELSALRKEVSALKNRVIEMEQQQESNERDHLTARHMAALFEDYVIQSAAESKAMLKSHETLKMQVESSEKLVASLAEKLVSLFSQTTSKIKTFEDVQAAHQNKLMALDRGGREAMHKVNQLRVRMSGWGLLLLQCCVVVMM